MTHTPSFGYWVRRRRKALDLIQARMADAAGCATVAIRKVERGVRRPSPEMAALLADRLALSRPDRERAPLGRSIDP